MKFLFFIAILFAAVSGLPLAKLVQDPASLLAALENVDPDSIARLEEYVVQLIAEGVSDEAMYTNKRNAAQTDLDLKTANLADALTALKNAQDIHAKAATKEAGAAADELQKGKDRASKLTILNGKKAVLAEAKTTNKNEQGRLNREKSLFQEIKGLLTKVKATVEIGRHLLAEEDADPNQVAAAIKLLNDLIAAGEVERQDVIDAQAAAQEETDTATSVYGKAVEVHTLAEGALEDAQLELANAKKVELLRTNEHETATAEKEAAVTSLDAAQAKLETESERIASEKIDLEQISFLLKKLK